MSATKSLILVTVDCLRADHTGFMGYARPTTPFLDRLAAESFVFPKAIATGAPTFYSFPGILASRFPLRLGREVIGIAPGEQTLASVLQLAGYRTAAFVAGNPYLSKRFGYAQNFELFEDFLSPSLARSPEDPAPSESNPRTRINQKIAQFAHKCGPLGRVYDDLYFEYCQRIIASKHENWDSLRRFPAADVLVDRACDWLNSIGNQPFFLWLHFMDPHAPYYPREESLPEIGPEPIAPDRARYVNAAWNRSDLKPERLRKYRDEILNLHDAGIRSVDLQLSRLVTALKGLSLWESSAFALTADHGEEFLDHGGRFHLPSRLYQEMLHVPLLLRVPGMVKRELSPAPFSHIHFAPTVLDAISVDAGDEFEGQSYWREMQDDGGWDMAVSESVGSCNNPAEPEKRRGSRMLTVQDRRFKLMIDFSRNDQQLFDLETDPQELRALAADAEKSARAALLRTALCHLEGRLHDGKAELSLRARLRQIGLEWSYSKMQPETLAS